MKLRHAAALALVGWYLMVPPTHDSGVWFHLWHGQFADWNLVRSFDSAKECEDYRKQIVGADEKAVPPPPPGFKVQAPYHSSPIAGALCIATDDPRLAK